MSTIYRVSQTDHRHPMAGVYVDVSGCFELPVGPFPNSDAAHGWVSSSARRLIELYGPAAASIAGRARA